MILKDLRQEVWDHGFGQNRYTALRVTNFLNDAQNLICRRVQFYTTESTSDFSTANGQATYPLPDDFAKVRSLRRTDVNRELQAVLLRDIDRSAASSGNPACYALDGVNLHLWPTPDAPYPHELRYWITPPQLGGDFDVPIIPPDYHRLLWLWAVKECYAADDDPQTAGYYLNEFNTMLAQFTADVKFPNNDAPAQIGSYWDEGQQMSSRSMGLY